MASFSRIFLLCPSFASYLPPSLEDWSNISLLCGSLLSRLSPLSWRWVPSQCFVTLHAYFDYSTYHLVLWWTLGGSTGGPGSTVLFISVFLVPGKGLIHDRCPINASWISLYGIRWLLSWEAGVLGQCNQDTERTIHNKFCSFLKFQRSTGIGLYFSPCVWPYWNFLTHDSAL